MRIILKKEEKKVDEKDKDEEKCENSSLFLM